MTIRVLLADDQTLIRSGFRVLVSSAPDLEVVAEASNGREAVELARTERADVILMDIRMPELDGLAATRIITALDTFGFASLGLTAVDFESPDQVIQLGVPPVRVDLITSISALSWDEVFATQVLVPDMANISAGL